MRSRGIVIALIALVFVILGSQSVFASEYVVSTDGRFEYEVHETEQENYIYINKYLGEGDILIIPDVMDGYVVRGLYADILFENETVKEITLPNTLFFVEGGVFAAAYALENIYVENGFAEALHDEEGILYNGECLISYPSGRKDTTFIIPDHIERIQASAFYGCVNLEKLIVHEYVSFILNPFCRSQKPMDIIIKKTGYKKDYLTERCWQMKSGTRFLVANEELAEKYRAEIAEDYEYTSGSYNNNHYKDSKEPMAVEVYEPVPATDLTFADGTREKDITLIHYPDSADSNLNFFECIAETVQFPADTTDNVIWRVASADINESVINQYNTNGSVCAVSSDGSFMSYAGGRAVLKAQDDSGNEVILNVTLHCPVEEFELEGSEITIYAGDATAQTVYATLNKNRSYAFAKGAEWKIEDESVVQITESGKTTTLNDSTHTYCDGRVWCKLQSLKPGRTTLSVTVMDDEVPVTKTADISVKCDMENCIVEPIPMQIYTGKQICPEPIVRLNGQVLVKGTDYEVTYGDNTNTSGRVYIKGIGFCYGNITTSFDITTNRISDATVSNILKQNLSELLNGLVPDVEVTLGSVVLTKDEDYEVEVVIVSPEIGKVKIKGLNGYTGEVEIVFDINADISATTITEEMITIEESYPKYQKLFMEEGAMLPTRIYTTGEDILKTFKVVHDGKEIVLGEDYILKLQYEGEDGQYNIQKKPQFATGNWYLTVTGTSKDGYTGYIGSVTTRFAIYDNYHELLDELDKKESSPEPSPIPTPEPEPEPENISVKAPKLKSVKSKAKKMITVKWKKVSGADGYEIQCATNKRFTKNKKIVTIKKNIKTQNIKKLKSKKTYRVRIKAYKVVNGIKYYSAWSAIKKVKIK